MGDLLNLVTFVILSAAHVGCVGSSCGYDDNNKKESRSVLTGVV